MTPLGYIPNAEMVREMIRSPGKACTEVEMKGKGEREATIMSHLFLPHQQGALSLKSVEQSVM